MVVTASSGVSKETKFPSSGSTAAEHDRPGALTPLYSFENEAMSPDEYTGWDFPQLAPLGAAEPSRANGASLGSCVRRL